MILQKIIKLSKAGVSEQTNDYCSDKSSNQIFLLFLSCLAIDGKKGVISEGKPTEGTAAQVTITVSDDDFIDLALGKANAPAVRNSLTTFIAID